MLRRLAVFTGGFSAAAAGNVAAPGALLPEVFGVLASLVNKSLLTRTGDRFSLLETVRAYATARLAEDPVDEAATRRRHADFFVALAVQADSALHGREQNRWLAQLELEHDNLRAALDWSLHSEDVALALRLVAALAWFWYVHSYLDEGCRWAARVLNCAARGPDDLRARAMVGAALLHENRGAYETAEALLHDALPLARAAADEVLVGWCLTVHGLVARNKGEYERAAARLAAALAISRVRGERWMLEVGVLWLASVERYRGNTARALQLFDEALAAGRGLGDRLIMARVLAHLAGMLSDAGDPARAQPLAEECRGIRQEAGSRWTEGIGLVTLGIALLRQDQLDPAEDVLQQAFDVFRELGDGARVAYALNALAHVAYGRGEYARSAHLLGAAHAVRARQGEAQTTGLVLAGSFSRAIEALSERGFEAAFATGNALSPGEMLALVRP